MAAAAAPPAPLFSFALDRARAAVDAIPADRSVVLLGECTHGTQEFYVTRAEITKRLVEERGFTAVCLEGDFPFFAAVNDFLAGRRATPPEGSRFPSWMWTNEVCADLYEWCRGRAAASRPLLFGLDCYSLFESKRAVIAFLEKHDAAFAAEASARLAFLDKFDSGFAFARAMVGGNLSRVGDELTEMLARIQARLQWGSDKYACSNLERLNAEQNLEVVIAADEYYRKCVSEPRGSQASWNARDQHMATTLLRIQARLGDPKIVVWAHNSHVGDATATKRGGISFDSNETWNLGQMARATFGREKVWIVGQYTHRGVVTAAPEWGQKHAAVPLRPALPDSYEGRIHELYIRSDAAAEGKLVSFNTAQLLRAGAGSEAAAGAGLVAAGGAGSASSSSAFAAGLAELLGGPPRLQRWVGVSYHPDTELQSHYGEMALAACYDQIIFADLSNALAPVAPRPQPAGGIGAAGGAVAAAGGGAGGAGASGGGGGSGASRASTQRLVKELQRLQRAPPPGISAQPLESNLLEWHFVLRCEQAPYTGGEYHGRLDFPPEYPMLPPAFRVFTPSGRFEPGARLCLSMSDYHPESWNPAWSVETLLVGLMSFMFEESDAIGSVHASAAERQRLAVASRAFNAKNPVFCELFQRGASASAGGGGAATGAPLAPAASVCRFCYGSEGQLISPCMCRGSSEFLHLECLKTWQRSVVLAQPTHPKYQTSIDTVCNVCLEPFTGPGIATSRHEQILEYVGGAEIASLVAPGNLLVSTRESSRENVELMAAHPEIRARLTTWTKAVFLMLRGGDGKGLLAVSMSQPLAGPPADARLGRDEARQWEALRTAPPAALRVRHWDGGPLGRSSPIAVAHLRAVAAAEPAPAWLRGVERVPPSWVYGSFESVAGAVKAAATAAAASTAAAAAAASAAAAAAGSSSPPPVTINVVWGYGGWGETQVLAEIGRGGWGLVTYPGYLAQRPDAELDLEWEVDFEWSRTVAIARLPPPSEYSRSKRR